MTALLALLGKYWRPLAITLLVAFLLWRVFGAGYESADSAWKRQWLQRDLADSTATLHREVAERAEERRRQQAADEELERANEEVAKVQADADAAQRAGDGLQRQLTDLQRQLAGSETGRISAVAAAGAAKAQTGILLAQLLGEVDDLAGKFAKEADERYVAGSSCERTYDKVTHR
jgi:chromosome segregation ATPase